MGKFTVVCPECGAINHASTSLFAKKTIQCGICHTDINVKDVRMVSERCPHCGNTYIYDRAKGNKNACPVCGQKADTTAQFKEKKAVINCPQCACAITVDKNSEHEICPICDAEIDVKKLLLKEKLTSDMGVSVIQYEGDNSVFVWKHPIEDFNMGSQLIVHEAQEAIFFMNGEALDTFGPGRYTLETQSLPILEKLYNIPSGAQTPFHAEVYFINTTVKMALKWGTDSRVHFIDPVTSIPLDIGACGEMSLQVANSRKLMDKLVGTSLGFTSNDSSASLRNLQNYFKAPIMTEVKSQIASIIKGLQINIFEIDQHLSLLSDSLRKRIEPIYEDYGLIVPNFAITNVALPEDDPNFKNIKMLMSQAYLGVKQEQIKTDIAEAAGKRKMVEAQTEANIKAIYAQGDAEAIRLKGLSEAEVMRAKGYTEKDRIDAEVQKAYAESFGKMASNAGGAGGNGGGTGGSLAGDMMNFMAQMKMAETMMGKIDGFMSPANQNKPAENTAPAPAPAQTWTCSCGETQNRGKCCMNCGKPRNEGWTCSACGHSGNAGKFCEECGAPKPAEEWTCAQCGNAGNKGKFCEECGAKRPE